MDFYNAMIAERENSTINQEVLESGKVKTSSGTGEAKVEEIGLYNVQGERIECACVGDTVELRVDVKVYKKIKALVMGYGIKDRLGQDMYGTNTWFTEQVIKNPSINSEYRFIISFPINLGVGSYSIVVALHEGDTHLSANYDWVDLALVFNVVNVGKKQFSGCNWLEPKIVVEEK